MRLLPRIPHTYNITEMCVHDDVPVDRMYGLETEYIILVEETCPIFLTSSGTDLWLGTGVLTLPGAVRVGILYVSILDVCS